MSSDETPKLRMAPPEPAEVLEHRLGRERRAEGLQRETNLEQSLGAFRVGSVGALNAVPLTRGLEDQVLYAPPSQLAKMLQRNELDAALVSVVEVLFHDRYEVLDGVAVASLGEVKSVLLAHRKPLEEAQEVYCDPASLTSVELLRVLLAERGIHPAFKPLGTYDFSSLPDFALLIGDTALDFALSGHEHEIWDLGEAWFDLTKLPFVFAVWALQRGRENRELCRHLRDAHDFGLETLDSIIRNHPKYTYDFRNDYLGWHIHYHLGADEKRGLARFQELLRKHCGREIYPPRFVL